MSKRKVEVCLSPSLLGNFDLAGKTAVIVDVFRASSTICTALANGANQVIPVSSIEECQSFSGNQNYLLAAERNGFKVEGIPFGNSPLEYTQELVQNKTLVLTTTNGTRILNNCKSADKIIIGAFLNITTVANYLIKNPSDVLIGCAGWKGRFCAEDTLFAGALCQKLQDQLEIHNDAAKFSMQYYETVQDDVWSTIESSEYFSRMKSSGIEADVKYCLGIDQLITLPTFNGIGLTDAKNSN